MNLHSNYSEKIDNWKLVKDQDSLGGLADIAKLIEASDTDKVSELENHTRDEIVIESSDNDFDTINQQMNCQESI
ncbi:hypothetical protein TNCV_1563421 [Trichonephila clavipes]|nr:hypothetical protein TNCV_1563421 [Trichonephila clavipes]